MIFRSYARRGRRTLCSAKRVCFGKGAFPMMGVLTLSVLVPAARAVPTQPTPSTSIATHTDPVDCAHMLSAEARLIHRINKRRHEPRLPANAPGYAGLAVRLDPMPGLGIMQGGLWTSEAGWESDKEVAETLEALESQRHRLHDSEVTAHCPVAP